jgi:hypothetical protein
MMKRGRHWLILCQMISTIFYPYQNNSLDDFEEERG